MESDEEKIYYDWLLKFLKENQGKAFTVKALLERLEEIVIVREERDYGRKNLHKILDKMKYNNIIKSVTVKLYKKETYYWFSDPEYPLRTPANFVHAHKKSSIGMPKLDRIAGIIIIIGFIFIIAGGVLTMFIPMSLTLVIVGILIIFVGIMIATRRSGCWKWCDFCS